MRRGWLDPACDAADAGDEAAGSAPHRRLLPVHHQQVHAGRPLGGVSVADPGDAPAGPAAQRGHVRRGPADARLAGPLARGRRADAGDAGPPQVAERQGLCRSHPLHAAVPNRARPDHSRCSRPLPYLRGRVGVGHGVDRGDARPWPGAERPHPGGGHPVLRRAWALREGLRPDGRDVPPLHEARRAHLRQRPQGMRRKPGSSLAGCMSACLPALLPVSPAFGSPWSDWFGWLRSHKSLQSLSAPRGASPGSKDDASPHPGAQPADVPTVFAFFAWSGSVRCFADSLYLVSSSIPRA
mmetsp:Transcript_8027/g.22308  ORF Transcript_8027/g.22308 Transcript_8027/m.22308 type:complete len:297 (-) Transcript_8027:100-990(-)